MTADFITGATAADFYWYWLLGAVVTAGCFGASFLFLFRTRLMENMPTSRLRSAAQGYVELEGRGVPMPGPPIVAPLTRTRCLWWRYRVERRERGRKNSRWVTVNAGLSDECFELRDDTGHCVVDPEGASVLPTRRQRWYGSSPTPDVGPGLGGGWLRAAFSPYRYTEEVLLPAEPLYALGSFRTQTGATDRFDEQVDVRDMLSKWKHDRRMISMLDVNKDGAIDMKEWEAARRMATQKVRAEHVERAVNTPDLNVVGRPKDGRPYILSAVPQAALIRRYRGYAAACFGAMVLGTGALTWALTVRGGL